MRIAVKRRIDEFGRLVVPKDYREYYGIEEGDLIEFIATDEGIIIRKAEKQPPKEKSNKKRTQSKSSASVGKSE